MTDTKQPTADWQRLFVAHHSRTGTFKTSRWKKPTEDEERAKRQVLDECALEAAHAQLVSGFDGLLPGAVWSRPAAIPEDDRVLIWHLKVAQQRTVARASREIASDFWRWRWHVLEVEREDGAKAAVLLRGLQSLLDVRDGLGAGLAAVYRGHLDKHFGRAIGATHAPERLPETLPREVGPERSEWGRLVYQLTRREATLPTWLAWFGSVRPPPDMRPRAPDGATKVNQKPAHEPEEKDDEQDEW